MYWRYLKSLLLHKWYVFRAGRIVGHIPLWRLIVHDWQKFTGWEFSQYARNFQGDRETSPEDRAVVELEFAYAWLHHENTAPHHWGYWIPRSGKRVGQPLDMPEIYCREMVADWMGAGRTYTGSWDMCEWLTKNFHINAERPLVISAKTREVVSRILSGLGYLDDGDKYIFRRLI